MLKPAAAVLAAGFLFSCASSNDSMDSTAMEETTTMSETQTMAGDDVTVETEVSTDMDMEADMETSSMTILDAAGTRSDISTFMSLLQTANITAALEGEGEFTMFAPTNKAFEALPAGQLEYLKKPENRNELIKVLQAHVIANKVTTAQLQSNQRIQISDTDYIEVGAAAGANPNTFTIGGANIVEPNIEASNGVIHVVDRVLVTADQVMDKK
ncbi:fasciclin domain-containing protein [Pontibacter sp. JH31]|uniref:Fasciclin domain-containing protein n=2 Tax=Pontibacter aquaedesilientis TaxID=2766980 RepID=A0ABR7XEU0_9BACT|nr:fasciclin domain-containing protein [Pontibacter aquaedesilientis]